MIFDFCQCHVGCRRSNKQFISKSGWVRTQKKHVGSTPLVLHVVCMYSFTECTILLICLLLIVPKLHLSRQRRLDALFQVSVKSRSQPWTFFTKSYLFAQSYLHPVKWSPLVNHSEQHVQLLCTRVLPFMHDPFSRLL